MKSFLIIACIPFLCAGCASILNTLEVPPPVFTGVEHREIPQSDKVLEIPTYDESRGSFAGKPFVYYSWAKSREEQLNLGSPELSETNKMLRVWATFSNHPRRQTGCLAEFVHNGTGWSGRFYDYDLRYNQWGNTETIMDTRSFELTPATGWDKFDEILQETRFVDLPTDENVPGLKEWMIQNRIHTATTYSVEYCTPIFYRFFIYQNPLKTEAQFDEAADFMRFLRFMFEIVNHSDPRQTEQP